MRAARVLDMLLTLQRRGRMTAPDLAELLEVSERTILRDVEALGEAGVPIFTIQGAGGGIELMDGFETRLTGLTVQEASSMFLAGQLDVATRLGLGGPARTARRKLVEALSPQLRDEAEALSQWLLHDPETESGARVPRRDLRRIASGIHRNRVMEITIGDAPATEVHPLGLALEAGSWHVVVAGSAHPEVLCIDDLRATRITRHEFAPPHGFSLAEFWQHYVTPPQ